MSLVLRPALAAALCLPTLAVAGPIHVDPDSDEVELEACETVERSLHVLVPPGGTPAAVDVYLLADTTGSMEPAIAAVQEGAKELVDDLRAALPGVDLRFAVGNYRDFPGEAYAFDHQLVPSGDPLSIQLAIGAWKAESGGDAPEGQLFALDALARDADPAGGSIGWRPGAERIVVWFGDAPGHDPICGAISGLPYDITEAGVTDALVDAGIEVVAISNPTGISGGLDGDPTVSTWAYAAYCGVGGAAGQATRIAEATGGAHATGIDEDAMVDTIVDMVETQVRGIGLVEIEPSESIARFVDRVSGPVEPIGASRRTQRLPFDVRYVGDAACDREERVFEGTLDVYADGSLVADQHVTVIVPACTWHPDAYLVWASRWERQVVVVSDGRFEARRIDADTVLVDGRSIRGFELEDVDGDGDADAVVSIGGAPLASHLTGLMIDGYPFEADLR